MPSPPRTGPDVEDLVDGDPDEPGGIAVGQGHVDGLPGGLARWPAAGRRSR